MYFMREMSLSFSDSNNKASLFGIRIHRNAFEKVLLLTGENLVQLCVAIDSENDSIKALGKIRFYQPLHFISVKII